MKTKGSLSAFFLLLACMCAQGQRLPFFQVSNVFTEETSHFAAPTHYSEKEFAQVGGIFSSGIFKEMRRFYFVGLKQISADKNHAAGLSVLRDQRGDQIHETVINGIYRNRIDLNEQYALSLGTLVGVYNSGINASDVSPGDNGWAFNLDFSATLSAKKWSSSLYMKHATRPQMTLLESQVIYPRIFGVYASANLVDRPIWSSKVTVHGTVLDNRLFMISSWDQTLWESYTVGVNVGNQAFGVFTGLKEFPVDKVKLKLLVGYQVPLSPDVISSLTRVQIHIAVF